MRIIDSHVHLENHNPKKAVEMADHFGYEKFALMAIPCYGNPLNTLESLLAKRAAPGRIYTFGGMVYTPDQRASGKDHEKQLELMLEAGCDGFKLLESKPDAFDPKVYGKCAMECIAELVSDRILMLGSKDKA